MEHGRLRIRSARRLLISARRLLASFARVAKDSGYRKNQVSGTITASINACCSSREPCKVSQYSSAETACAATLRWRTARSMIAGPTEVTSSPIRSLRKSKKR
ncbi:hypothetical protein D3C81_1778540 [compost metagenome]